jgi:hypothetical protein
MHIHSPLHYIERGPAAISRGLNRSRSGRHLKQGFSTLTWLLSNSRPTGEAASVARELRQNGIAVTSVERLGLRGELIEELSRECLRLTDDPAGFEGAKDLRTEWLGPVQ